MLQGDQCPSEKNVFDTYVVLCTTDLMQSLNSGRTNIFLTI